jgi:hypothetical protein
VSCGMNRTGIEQAIRLKERSNVARQGRLQCSRLETESMRFWERSRLVRC